MSQQDESGWTRRDFAGAAILLALVVGVPVGVLNLAKLPRDEAPTDRQTKLMREVSQTLLPRTDAPGAGDVDAGGFAILALAHGLDSSRTPGSGEGIPQLARFRRTDGSLRHVEWLENELDSRSRGDFLARNPDEKLKVLAKLDSEAFAEGFPDHPWKVIKGLILTGYYTSEVGGSRELRYELVPGRWDPDLPLKPTDRAFSSDWTAVDFG